MNLNDYSEQINLYQPWQPKTGKTDEREVINELLTDPAVAPYLSQLGSPKLGKEREWLRALLTVRQPSPNEPLFTAVDKLLAADNQTKQLFDANSLVSDETFSLGDKKISLWQGDITTLKVDAIVNAANSQLLGCFQPFHPCIDNAIHIAAGPRLREDCQTLISLQGHLEKTGQAKITRAYNLPSKFVIHTVGPIVSKGATPTLDDKEALASCYQQCMSLAEQTKRIESIAFCAISTGIFGFPKQQAAQVAWESIHSRLTSDSKLKHVIINTFDDETTAIYKALITSAKGESNAD